MIEDGNTPTGTSTQDAAQSIAALLTDDLEAPESGEAPEVADTQEAATDEVVTPDSTEDAPEEPTASAPEKLRIVLDGEEVDEDIIRSWKAEDAKAKLRQADYTKKTTEIAEQRKAFEQEQATTRSQYAQKLKALDDALQQATPQRPNFAELVKTLPVDQYLQVKAAWEEHDARMAALAQERQQAEAAVLADQQAQAKAQAEAARDRLFTLLPDWKDESVRKQDWEAMKSYAEELGISEQEMLGARPELFKMAKDAVAYRKLQQQAKQAPATVKAAPKGLVVVKPGTRSEPSDPKMKAVETAKRRLGQTHHVNDAASLIEHLL